ncbi:DUF1707 SHOCT-like domain-containing protein [Pseudonocardia sp. D17]|uniref:DUF1707 SHOCT-like domain-containing protein n=1 Tax=Pseudonocardia sp. D17 TaxID=882661 RepID=UPI002B3A8C94|nr:hypothetical protein PSD17_30890 [Pseudonocardia sp. D17]
MSEVELRISDDDRDRAAAVLHSAVGEGRLTWVEHDERLAAVYSARTASQLRPALADLPGGQGSAPARTVTHPAAASPVVSPGAPVRVTLGKVSRRPDVSGGRVEAEAVLGVVVLDLRDLAAHAVVDVVANSLLGKVEVHVSPGTRLVDAGTAALGKRSVVERRSARGVLPRPDSPTVRLSGHSVLGHVRVHVG